MIIEEVYKPIGLYIHIPFCARKCNYCDFLSFNRDENIQRRYIEALINEIKLNSKIIEWNSIVDTIYFGGGTPSYIDSNLIKKVLDTINNNYRVAKNVEITIEVNPGTVTEQKIADYKVIGINRISIGLQSTNNNELKQLGRIHTYEEFLDNYKIMREYGFDNISIDVMSAIPMQDIESYKQTLQRIVDLKPEHISSYSLIIEEGTPFSINKDKLKLVSEDDERKMYELTNEILKKHGYKRYEISNYCLEGKESKHNSRYWDMSIYYGLGLGASSYDGKSRYNKVRSINGYTEELLDIKEIEEMDKEKAKKIIDNIICDIEEATIERNIEEFMFLGLRRSEGISKEKFKSLYPGHKSVEDVYGEVISKYINMGLMEDKDDRLTLTDKGIDVSNVILADFLV